MNPPGRDESTRDEPAVSEIGRAIGQGFEAVLQSNAHAIALRQMVGWWEWMLYPLAAIRVQEHLRALGFASHRVIPEFPLEAGAGRKRADLVITRVPWNRDPSSGGIHWLEGKLVWAGSARTNANALLEDGTQKLAGKTNRWLLGVALEMSEPPSWVTNPELKGQGTRTEAWQDEGSRVFTDTVRAGGGTLVSERRRCGAFEVGGKEGVLSFTLFRL